MALRLDAPRSLRLGERDVPLELRRHPQARRITLRLTPEGDGVRLVLPNRTPIHEAVAFAERNSGWILKHLAKVPERIPFADGAVIPLLGENHVVTHDPAARGGVIREPGLLRVSGQPEHLPRRLGDFLKREARAEIGARARDKAARVERRVGRLSLRDTRSRWGSCNSDGDLNFSWRLILAPEVVLDYVVAHEVAHLVHLNHSQRFWKLAGRLSEDMSGAKIWLRRNANELWRYG
ncbi:M48 family metallopeptidase [Pelagibius marinus]|uniref:M48 family metallopeptidase n=1 Tax=Pelagibius marinus TaxID=2762760 RepID=UPI0018723311|nr:SprT family zinc-dependent metalloprotease [Pelagibius marinus]